MRKMIEIGKLATIVPKANDYPFLSRNGNGGLSGPRAALGDVYVVIGFERRPGDDVVRARYTLLRTSDRHIGELWSDEVVAL